MDLETKQKLVQQIESYGNQILGTKTYEEAMDAAIVLLIKVLSCMNELKTKEALFQFLDTMPGEDAQQFVSALNSHMPNAIRTVGERMGNKITDIVPADLKSGRPRAADHDDAVAFCELVEKRKSEVGVSAAISEACGKMAISEGSGWRYWRLYRDGNLPYKTQDILQHLFSLLGLAP